MNSKESSIHIPSNLKTSSLTPEQHKQLLIKQLKRQQTSTIGDYQLGKIKSWSDFSKSSGFNPPEQLLSESFNVLGIRKAFDIALIELEKVQDEPRSERSPPSNLLDNKTDWQLKSEEYDNIYFKHYSSNEHCDTIDTLLNGEKDRGHKKKPEIVENEFSHISALIGNPKIQSVPFQIRHTSNILRCFMRDGHRARALSAGVGTGKTFILGAVIKEMIDRKWKPIVESISPYPIMYVTRATVVEQTERVLFDMFGLRRGYDCFVTNIDQLRASLGDELIHEEVKVEYGQERIIYNWFEPLAPALMILDEAHCVKNVDSIQSKIMQSFNDLSGEHYSIYSSATLWTRVIESKCFSVACKLEW